MAINNISPEVDNYYMGRGSCYWKPDGGSSWRHMGNATIFQFQASPKQLDHFSSQLGIKSKDLSVVIEQNATVKLTLEEFTADNLALAFMDEEPGGSTGTITGNIMTKGIVRGSFAFVGANDIGAKLYVELPIVTVTPSKAIDLIGADTFGTIELTGDVLVDATADPPSFGIYEWNTTKTAPA